MSKDSIVTPSVVKDMAATLRRAANKEIPVKISLLSEAATIMEAIVDMPKEVAAMQHKMGGLVAEVEDMKLAIEQSQRLVHMVRDGFALINAALAQFPAPQNIDVEAEDQDFADLSPEE